MIARRMPSRPLIRVVFICSRILWSFLNDGSPASTTNPFTLFAEVSRALLDVDLHDRRRWDAPRVHDLDQSREAEGDVHLRDPRVVERSHRHLRAGLTDRLRGHDARALVRVDPVALVPVADPGD